MPAGKANLGPNFYPKLVQVASELGMKPEDLIAVMVSESGLNPSAYESKFKGAGLVGFMPDTLKGLKFKGTWEDFTKLSGEEQLDWLKKLVQGYAATNGGPLKSAAQYYVANLWPVALKLPGIRQGDPNTAFIEANPETVTDKTGHKWSKKYYDIGIKIDPTMESNAHKYNPLFDRDKKGSITYGDMMKQVEINKRNPLYQKAMMAMNESTGYAPGKQEPTMVADNWTKKYLEKNKGDNVYDEMARKPSAPTAPSNVSSPGLLSTLTNYLQQVAASEKTNKKLYKKFLPVNHMVIRVEAGNFVDSVEFARILCSALHEELMARAFTHTDGTVVEIDCAIPGPSSPCFEAAQQLTDSVVDSFKTATKKIGGIGVKTQFITNKTSSYQEISLKTANNQYRKFLLKFI